MTFASRKPIFEARIVSLNEWVGVDSGCCCCNLGHGIAYVLFMVKVARIRDVSMPLLARKASAFTFQDMAGCPSEDRQSERYVAARRHAGPGSSGNSRHSDDTDSRVREGQSVSIRQP